MNNLARMRHSTRIILLEDNKMLLGLRADKPYAPNQWMLPGGTLEAGETALAGVIREAQEEVGVVMQPEDLRFAGVVHWWNDQRKDSGFTLNWTCSKWGGVLANQEPTECQKLAWLSQAEIAELAAQQAIESTTLAILLAVMAGQHDVYLECDWL